MTSCVYALIDCRIRVIKFHIPNEPVMKWSSCSGVPKGRVISYLNVRKLFSKGYFYHFVRVNDAGAEVLSLYSVPIVREFLEVFLMICQESL